MNRAGRLLLAVSVTFVGLSPASSEPTGLRVSVQPLSSAADAPVRILVTGARPGSHVAISASRLADGRDFAAAAQYVSDSHGVVDVGAQAPVRGSYDRRDAMGLFWSATPVAGRPFHHGAASFDFLAPARVTLRATNGAHAAEAVLLRRTVEPGIRRIPVREAGVVGTFFMHAGNGRRPAIVVLGGAEGGVSEDRAALVATHGFNALALAYFGADNLPRSLALIPIEDVEAAIDWLERQPSVRPGPVAVVGGSKGAELALLAGAHFKNIGAVVAYAPSSVVFEGLFYGKSSGPAPSSWTLHGRPLPYADGEVPKSVEAAIATDIRAKRPVSYAPEYLAKVRDARDLNAATIPVERIGGPVLLISGDDDRLWPSSPMALAIQQRLRRFHHAFCDRWLRYRSAGHAIGEPYYISTQSTIAHLPRYALALGGSASENAAASEDSWPRMIAFLQAATRPGGPRRCSPGG
jgi:dienelactone hydrolase